MSSKVYIVKLRKPERQQLETLIRKGKSGAARILKARILLKADCGRSSEAWPDERIVEALDTNASMVYRVRRGFAEKGLEAILKHGSWLNMAETELSVLSRQCLDRRVPDKSTLDSEAIPRQ